MKLYSLHILVSMYSRVRSSTSTLVVRHIWSSTTDHHDPDYHLESHSMQGINKTAYLYVLNCIA